MDKLRYGDPRSLLAFLMLFLMLGFSFLAVKGSGFAPMPILFGGVCCLSIALSYSILLLISRHIDRYLMVVVYVLLGIGLLLQYRMDPETAQRQLLWAGIGFAAMLFMLLLIKYAASLYYLRIPIMILSLALLGVLLVIGKESGGAKNWIIVGNMSLQPSELVKVALVLVLSSYLSGSEKLRDIWPCMLFTALSVGFLVLERDLGAALLLMGSFLILYFIRTGNLKITLLCLLLAGAGAVLSYYLFDHVQARVAVWKNPWASYYTSGYQIAQGLMAIASGGIWGLGFTLGSPKSIPAYHTDYIFAVICEEFGLLFGIGVIALYLVFIVRGALLALGAPNRLYSLLAFGSTTLITLQSFIIIGGVIKLIPLTGITLPFVSYGGSSILACMLLLGILQGVAMVSGNRLENAMEELLVPEERGECI